MRARQIYYMIQYCFSSLLLNIVFSLYYLSLSLFPQLSLSATFTLFFTSPLLPPSPNSSLLPFCHLHLILYFSLTATVPHALRCVHSEAFSGVVTLDKLRKEYKRVGPPGVQQLWDALAAHLQAQVAANSTNLSFLSMYVITPTLLLLPNSPPLLPP